MPVCILMAVALVDLDTFTIPNGFVLAGCVLWLVTIWFMPAPRADAFSVGSLFAGWVHPGGSVALDGIVGAVGAAGGCCCCRRVRHGDETPVAGRRR